MAVLAQCLGTCLVAVVAHCLGRSSGSPCSVTWALAQWTGVTGSRCSVPWTGLLAVLDQCLGPVYWQSLLRALDWFTGKTLPSGLTSLLVTLAQCLGLVY